MLFLLNCTVFLILIILIISKRYLFEKALISAFLLFIFSLVSLVELHTSIASFLPATLLAFTYINTSVNFLQGFDGISMLFIIFSAFLNILCVLSSLSINYRQKLYLVLLFLIQFLLLNLFTATELFSFYIFFEAILIPVFLIIGIWGSRQEKITAAYQFFLYTLLGSLFMLLSIVYILVTVGSTNFLIIKAYEFSSLSEKIIWFTLFLSFAVKIPMFPFHLWLPKAHVEAPTAGSVLLAGILLKLGSYGFIRFSHFLFPSSTEFFRPLILVLALLGVIYSSFVILRQVDLKRIIAYSSISHMNFVILGCFGASSLAFNGAVLLMLAHGLVSGGLFLGVGYLYDRYKTRNIFYYRGLGTLMPFYTVVFFILLLSNLGFPLTLNFISEFFILAGMLQTNATVAFLSTISILFAGISAFWIFTRIFFGSFNTTYAFNRIPHFCDVTRREYYSLIPLIFLTILLGICPNIGLHFITFSTFAWGM